MRRASFLVAQALERGLDGGLVVGDDRVATRRLIAGRDNRVQRQRVVLGSRERLLGDGSDDPRLLRGEHRPGCTRRVGCVGCVRRSGGEGSKSVHARASQHELGNGAQGVHVAAHEQGADNRLPPLLEVVADLLAGPMSAVSSMSCIGTAAAASCFLPSR